jgi:hypothetical protein
MRISKLDETKLPAWRQTLRRLIASASGSTDVRLATPKVVE